MHYTKHRTVLHSTALSVYMKIKTKHQKPVQRVMATPDSKEDVLLTHRYSFSVRQGTVSADQRDQFAANPV
jgi:hypothetical protein